MKSASTARPPKLVYHVVAKVPGSDLEPGDALVYDAWEEQPWALVRMISNRVAVTAQRGGALVPAESQAPEALSLRLVK